VAKQLLRCTVNGEAVEVLVQPYVNLLDALRENLGLTGPKEGCGTGDCGACSVTLDGRLVCSCLVLGAEADGREVRTVEGLGSGGELHPVQDAFVAAGAVQCGFCTPGLVVATVDLLARQPTPTDDEIHEALSGNLCRCTGYISIIEAVYAARSAYAKTADERKRTRS